MPASSSANIDAHTVEGFGDEWDRFDQTELDPAEHRRLFEEYFSVFPFDSLPPNAEGFDLGCGSGRWAALAAERVGTLHCIDPAPKALAVARRRLRDRNNVHFHLATSAEMPLAKNSMDFGYSLGVLHHVPDTASALQDCVDRLKPGAPMLVYLYYRFDNRPSWFHYLWLASEAGRRVISRLPFGLRKLVAEGVAAGVYWPAARTARLAERAGANVSAFPLSAYRNCSFYTMRTDSLDRFGTRLEQRFTRAEITAMMEGAGLKDIRFRESEPFWVACGTKA